METLKSLKCSGPMGVSLVVLVLFGVATIMVLGGMTPAGVSQTASERTLELLGLLTTYVVSYWVGSSNGSTEKTAHLVNLATAATPTPPKG